MALKDRMSYWAHAHNWRYEAHKRVERACLWLAHRMPAELCKWVVVDATNRAREMYPHPTGYAGPDGLGYREIYDGARRVSVVGDVNSPHKRVVA